MELVKELPLAHHRVLRHTLLKGADLKFYTATTLKLYDWDLTDGRANFETTVYATNDRGQALKLDQPGGVQMWRYLKKEEATAGHDALIENFDRLMGLAKAPPPTAPKPAAAPAAAPAKPAAASPLPAPASTTTPQPPSADSAPPKS
ncbi:MAG: hypothetical protein HYY93_12100 [Planctomycetes bacterium]|nr:hypothetical protein [Planctomycetota bacterium]